MKSLILTLALLLTLPALGAAGPARRGLHAAADGRDRSASDTVVITGRDGRVTGVERRPEDGRRNGEGDHDRERGRDRERPPQGGGGQGN